MLDLILKLDEGLNDLIASSLKQMCRPNLSTIPIRIFQKYVLSSRGQSQLLQQINDLIIATLNSKSNKNIQHQQKSQADFAEERESQR